MKFNLFSSKKKNKGSEEKSHREPIMVKIFKENDKKARVNVDIGDDTAGNDINTDSGESSSRRKSRFVPNDKYFSITIYALCAVLLVVLISLTLIKITPIIEAIKKFLHVIAPFLVGGILAAILTPIVNWLDEAFFEKLLKLKKPKLRLALSVVLTYIVFLGLLAVALVILIPEVGKSLAELFSKSKTWYSSIMNSIEGLKTKFPSVNFDKITEALSSAWPNIVGSITDILKSSFPKLLNTSISMVSSLIDILLSIAISIYLVCDKRRMAQGATKICYCLMKPEKCKSFIANAKECFRIFTGFIIGKSIDSLIIGIMTFFFLKLLNLPYALLVAVIVGVTNMIPFFGPFIGAIPCGILYLCIDPIYTLIFAIMIFIIQQFDGWILGPMILGDSTGIRPIWVIFGITVGGAYFGFAGMFLGVPFTAVIVYLGNKAVDKKLAKKKIEVL